MQGLFIFFLSVMKPNETLITLMDIQTLNPEQVKILFLNEK